MPRPRRVPAYTLHKPSGQARVILDGRHVYLGTHGSPERREKYARLIAERLQRPREPCGPPPAVSPRPPVGRLADDGTRRRV